MQITFNPIISQNKNSNPIFKAKKINLTNEVKEKAFETLAAGSAVLGSVLVALNQKIKEEPTEQDILIQQAIVRNTNEKTASTIELILTKDALKPEKENLISVLDFIGHISENIENIEFDCLSKYLMSITPKSLKYAKALSEIFPKLDQSSDILLSNFNHKINKDSRWDAREPYLNKLNLPPEEFIGIANLLEFNIEENAFLQSVDHSLRYKNGSVNLKDMLSDVFREYTAFRLARNNNDADVPFEKNRRDAIFIDTITEYLRENHQELNPFMLSEYIKSIRPYNKKEIDFLCSKNTKILDKNIISDINLKEDVTRMSRISQFDRSGIIDLIQKYNTNDCPESLLYSFIQVFMQKMNFAFGKKEKFENLDKVLNLYNKLLINREKYINSGIEDKESLLNFFTWNIDNITKLVYVFDEKTINSLFSKRLNNVSYYLESFYKFPNIHLELLKDLAECKTPEGNDLSDNEKLNLIHLIKAFADIDIRKLEEMSLENTIDTKKLKRDLFLYIIDSLPLKFSQFQDISDEEINKWDMVYLPLILKSMDKNPDGFANLIEGCTNHNFFDYIHDPSNIYGQTNNKTKEIYTEHNLDYEKYLRPSDNCNVRFISKDKNQEALIQFGHEIKENIEALRSTPLKNFIDKRYSTCIELNEFYIPDEVINSKEKLTHFIQNILVQFQPIWKQAEENLNNPQRLEMAQNTLTIKGHFEQILENLEKTEIHKVEKNIDYTIKTWDRIPQKDIQQGSKSSCCIALDKENGFIMPNYLMNTSLNMIEIIDNFSGEIIGNALYYFATNENNENVFIIDNIEINNKYKPSFEVSKELREAITQYASNICKEITGKDYTPIYLGTQFNDIKIFDKTEKQRIKFLGELDCERIYLDAFEGWKNTFALDKKIDLYKLN